MNVYVESNFILELALEQEQSSSCDAILSFGEHQDIRLVLPAFSLSEPYETLGRRAKDRKALKDRVAQEMQQLSRSKPYTEKIEALQDVTSLLVQSIEEEQLRLNATIKHLLHIAVIIPLQQTVFVAAATFQASTELSPHDAIIYASVLEHLQGAASQPHCFLTRNSRDFDDPDIVDTLDKYQCKILFNFEHGFRFIRSATGTK